MKATADKEKIEEVLTRGVSEIYPSRDSLRIELQKRISSGAPLKIYLGADPTGEHLHLGHLTNILVLKRLQALGQKIIFLIGDFTARIGDPTGKMAERRTLTPDEVAKNMRTFEAQVARVISFSGENGAEIQYNSKWYGKMNLEIFMEDLLGFFTVQNMLQRDMFKERLASGANINLKEFVYPVLQGYDGVKMDVDVEVGGNDQIFNMNIGRKLRDAFIDAKDKSAKTTKGEKFFIATALLVNPDTGEKLMNKSEGGLINLDDEPEDMFGKVMALNDASMFSVAEFCTEMPMERIAALRKVNPRDAKFEIAGWVVRTLYGPTKAEKAGEEWSWSFSKKEFPKDAAEIAKPPEGTMLALVTASGVVKSNSEARRLIEQGGVEVDGVVKKDPQEKFSGEKVRIGKKHFFRVKQ